MAMEDRQPRLLAAAEYYSDSELDDLFELHDLEVELERLQKRRDELQARCSVSTAAPRLWRLQDGAPSAYVDRA
jgi:hypothetical protein